MYCASSFGTSLTHFSFVWFPSCLCPLCTRDETGVGDYIVGDMKNGGLRHVTGINYTDASKNSMATCLKEQIRSAVSLKCGWTGCVDTLEEVWRAKCSQVCHSEGDPVSLMPILHIPLNPELFHELNIERYELGKTGNFIFNHPEGTHDNRSWADALAVYTAEQAQPPPSTPIARVI